MKRRRREEELSPEAKALSARLLADPDESGCVYRALEQAVRACGPGASDQDIARHALALLDGDELTSKARRMRS